MDFKSLFEGVQKNLGLSGSFDHLEANSVLQELSTRPDSDPTYCADLLDQMPPQTVRAFLQHDEISSIDPKILSRLRCRKGLVENIEDLVKSERHPLDAQQRKNRKDLAKAIAKASPFLQVKQSCDKMIGERTMALSPDEIWIADQFTDAALRRDGMRTEELLKQMPNPGHLGAQALVCAAEKGDHRSALRLLKAGVDANTHNGQALINSCAKGDAPLVTLLLDHGADPAAQNRRAKVAIQLFAQTPPLSLMKREPVHKILTMLEAAEKAKAPKHRPMSRPSLEGAFEPA
jgi:hypothetical protein